MTTAKGGPPSILETLDPRVVREALSLAREGIWKDDVAAALGISVDTLDRWIKRGTDDPSDPLFGPFASAWHAADAVARIESVRRSRSSRKFARNEQWFAERRWPHKLGSRQQHVLSGPDGGPIVAAAVAYVVELPMLDPEPAAPVPATPERGDAEP